MSTKPPIQAIRTLLRVTKHLILMIHDSDSTRENCTAITTMNFNDTAPTRLGIDFPTHFHLSYQYVSVALILG